MASIITNAQCGTVTVLGRSEDRRGCWQALRAETTSAMLKQVILPVLFCIFIMFPGNVSADWINLTGSENSRNIAEIYVEEDQVTVKLEIFVDDLETFAELIPDDFFSQPIAGRPSLDERIRNFSEQTFKVIANADTRLTARIDLVEPRSRIQRYSPLVGSINPYTGRPIPGPPEDKRVLYVELSYPFIGKPQSLTFIPPLDDKGFPKVSIGFICYHLGVPVVDFRQLSEKSTLQLVWDDPWYSKFEKRQLRRTLESGVRTFLYIEPYEVRHEILVRVKDMMTWMDFVLRGDQFIEVDEFDGVRAQIAEFFMENEYVLIDGAQLKPILDRTSYVESSISRSRFIDVPERVPLNTAMIGVVITYLTDGIPQEVETRWDLFSERVKKVTATMTDPAGPFPYDLTPDDNILKWTNYLKSYTIPTVDQTAVDETHRGVPVPLLSLGCGLLMVLLIVIIIRRRRRAQPVILPVALICVLLAGAIMLYPYKQIALGSSVRSGHISNEQIKEITYNLLKNVYRAFDFREEEDVYDKLALSVDGNLLTEIYLQNRKSLLIEQAGGAQAKVIQVQVERAEIDQAAKSDGAINVRTNWSALGTVGHWGHVHTRRNVYDAVLSLAVVDGSWKITGIDVLEETRVDPYAQQSQAENRAAQ